MDVGLFMINEKPPDGTDRQVAADAWPNEMCCGRWSSSPPKSSPRLAAFEPPYGVANPSGGALPETAPLALLGL
jgi:hypothetical protein